LTWRLDFAAELSKALKALSPPLDEIPENSRFIFPTRRLCEKKGNLSNRRLCVDPFLYFNELKKKICYNVCDLSLK